MKDVPGLFADLTMAVEDLHGVTVEGQHPSHSPDMQEALLATVRVSLRRIHRIVLDIGTTLP